MTQSSVTHWSVALAAYCCLVLCRLLAAEPEYARVSFQGRVTGAGGVPLPNGSYDMSFRFYDAGATLLLTDEHAAENAVTVAAGLYTVLLGGGKITAGSESNLWSVFLNHPQVFVGISI